MPAGERAESAWRPERLRRSADFRRAFRKGRRYRGDTLKAAIAWNSLGVMRLGFSVSAKMGNAVRRNRLRRRVRGMVGDYWPRASVDIVVWPAVGLEQMSLGMLKSEMGRIGAEIRQMAQEGG